jgi:hypothetical protein
MLNINFDSGIKAQFAGHETFPLRLLWLKKAYDAVKQGADRGTFQEQAAIARFGVGRNMVLAIRHWALAAGVILEAEGVIQPTGLGHILFDDETGADPYLEDPATAWLVHYAFASTPEQTTTFFYAFNGVLQGSFDRAALVRGLLELVDGRRTWRVSANTLKRDVEVFVRSYVSRDGGEDAAEPLLAELCLIREVASAGQFEFVRGPKPTLPDEIFAWALHRYWQRWHAGSPTLSMEQVAYGVGSPGRVFKLDEESIHARLSRIAESTNGGISWTDTAGLRQVIFHHEPNEEALVRSAFCPRLRSVV